MMLSEHFHVSIHPLLHGLSARRCPMSPHRGSQAIGTGSGILGFRPCWCPSPFSLPSMSRGFPFTLLQLPLDFIHLFFTVAVSAPTTNPPSYSRLGTGTMVIGYLKRLRYHGGGVICMHTYLFMYIMYLHTLIDNTT